MPSGTRSKISNYRTDPSADEYVGGGLGVGIRLSLSGNEEWGDWFGTSCIGWDDHEGFGRITTAGGGVIVTYSVVYITTPQTYQSYTGWGWGLDASVVTSVGTWFLGR